MPPVHVKDAREQSIGAIGVNLTFHYHWKLIIECSQFPKVTRTEQQPEMSLLPSMEAVSVPPFRIALRAYLQTSASEYVRGINCILGLVCNGFVAVKTDPWCCLSGKICKPPFVFGKCCGALHKQLNLKARHTPPYKKFFKECISQCFTLRNTINIAFQYVHIGLPFHSPLLPYQPAEVTLLLNSDELWMLTGLFIVHFRSHAISTDQA